MSTAVVPPPLPPVGSPTKRRMTTEEMLALPRDGKERWLIDGELRDKNRTLRDPLHGEAVACVTTALKNWLDQQPDPKGKVLCGDVGVCLHRNPDLTVGIDVVYVPPDVVAVQRVEKALVDGVPGLAVEILARKDTFGEIDEKITAFLSAGVPHVWVIDPYRRTLVVHRPNGQPALFNPPQEVTAEPQLPGFRAPVSRLFE